MELEQFARTILFGTRLEDKLMNRMLICPTQGGGSHFSAPVEVPRFPGRPDRLARIGRAVFPERARFSQDSARGQLLHFFANHELLAMELMALMLLRFPEADPVFREGIAQTITEEQSHLRLYLERMRELGVDFGDLPVSDYFWNSIKGMESPLQFITQMSLTLEQANLDFSLYYRDAVSAVGDEKTAALLDRVYQEEIGHVKHGLGWFNRWRGGATGEDDWDAYLRLLPPPMTPRRAKGIGFSAVPRRAAGLSERFIQELEVYAGSKGRPPVVWLFNPLCDSEIARGKPGFRPSETVQRRVLDLECLPMYLALETDLVAVSERPRAEWLKELRSYGIPVPEFRELKALDSPLREAKIGGVEPWGWSPEVFEKFRPWQSRLISMEGANGAWSTRLLQRKNFSETGLGPLFSKNWSVEFFTRWLKENPSDQKIFGHLEDAGEVFQDWTKARQRITESLRPVLAKAPWGTSGTQNKKILHCSELDSPLGGWLRNTLKTQGSLILEPLLDKRHDLSLQLFIKDDEVRVLGIRQFVTGSHFEYRGSYLDPRLSALPPEWLKFLHTPSSETALTPLERWKELARALGRTLRELGYQGPAGIDALLWKTSDGQLRLKPLVELNPRWTLGRLALELEAFVLPGARALWAFIPAREFSERIRKDFPVQMTEASGNGGPRILNGVVFTNDPVKAREVLTALVVGDDACDWFSQFSGFRREPPPT